MPNRDAVFMLDVTEDAGAPSIHVTTPASVMVVADADQLKERLDAYSDPIKNKAIKNTLKERRWYVEKILPALRFYCNKLNVPAPDWLTTNGHWERMTDEEKEGLFGDKPIKLREFVPVERPDIEVIRNEEEEQPGG